VTGLQLEQAGIDTVFPKQASQWRPLVHEAFVLIDSFCISQIGSTKVSVYFKHFELDFF
jgi:hypothetical protein